MLIASVLPDIKLLRSFLLAVMVDMVVMVVTVVMVVVVETHCLVGRWGLGWEC